mmetsp:Transcript_1954/g.6305  ORF Transcript_1954/g.6305 Transcript_1954/m.6305 type:complete len:275 (-) Transcript_1954:1085-1909(-)
MGPGADKHVRARGIVVCSAGVECGIEAWRGGIGERRAWQVAWVGVSGGEGGAPSCCCWSACKVTQLESSSKTSSPAQQSMPLTLESAGNHSDRRSAANASGSRPTHASTCASRARTVVAGYAALLASDRRTRERLQGGASEGRRLERGAARDVELAQPRRADTRALERRVEQRRAPRELEVREAPASNLGFEQGSAVGEVEPQQCLVAQGGRAERGAEGEAEPPQVGAVRAELRRSRVLQRRAAAEVCLGEQRRADRRPAEREAEGEAEGSQAR